MNSAIRRSRARIEDRAGVFDGISRFGTPGEMSGARRLMRVLASWHTVQQSNAGDGSQLISSQISR